PRRAHHRRPRPPGHLPRRGPRQRMLERRRAPRQPPRPRTQRQPAPAARRHHQPPLRAQPARPRKVPAGTRARRRLMDGYTERVKRRVTIEQTLEAIQAAHTLRRGWTTFTVQIPDGTI